MTITVISDYLHRYRDVRSGNSSLFKDLEEYRRTAELQRISLEIPEQRASTKCSIQPLLFKVMVVRVRSLHDDHDGKK